jgi:hypothetical protein
VGVGKALVLVLGAGGDVERGVGDREEHEEAGAAKAVGGVCDGGVDGKSVVEQRRSENKEGVFEALPSEVTWTAEWWQEQEELDACRAAWCIHCLAFDDRDLLLEVCLLTPPTPPFSLFLSPFYKKRVPRFHLCRVSFPVSKRARVPCVSCSLE